VCEPTCGAGLKRTANGVDGCTSKECADGCLDCLDSDPDYCIGGCINSLYE